MMLQCCCVFHRAGFSESFLQPLKPARPVSPRDELVKLHINLDTLTPLQCRCCAGTAENPGKSGGQQHCRIFWSNAAYDGSRSCRRRHRPSCLIHGSDGRRGPVLQGPSSVLFDPWFVRPRPPFFLHRASPSSPPLHNPADGSSLRGSGPLSRSHMAKPPAAGVLGKTGGDRGVDMGWEYSPVCR